MLKLQLMVRDSERHLVIKRKHEPQLKKKKQKMKTCLIPVKTVYVSLASAHGLVSSGRKYDYFLTFYPQPNQWWILGVCRNELTPSYLFPK